MYSVRYKFIEMIELSAECTSSSLQLYDRHSTWNLSIFFFLLLYIIFHFAYMLSVYLFVCCCYYFLLLKRARSCRRHGCGLLLVFSIIFFIVVVVASSNRAMEHIAAPDDILIEAPSWMVRSNGFIVEQRNGVAIYNNFININKNHKQSEKCMVCFLVQHDVFANHAVVLLTSFFISLFFHIFFFFFLLFDNSFHEILFQPWFSCFLNIWSPFLGCVCIFFTSLLANTFVAHISWSFSTECPSSMPHLSMF